MAGIPQWARDHLDRQLPGNPVLSGVELSRNRVLAATRGGAVLVQRSLFGAIRHTFVEAAGSRVAFRCGGCGHNLQFYGLRLPATVYCSICAAKYHLDAAGAVSDAAGQEVPAEAHAAGTGCACCAEGCCGDGTCCDHSRCGACCERTGCCAQGCDAARCCPEETCQCCTAAVKGEEKNPEKAEAAEPAKATPATVTGFTHNGYTLYKREVETKSGSRPLYFFSKGSPKSGEASPLPEGHEVGVNDRTGLPFLRRGPGTAAPRLGYRGDSHPVIDLEGIGPTWAERLSLHGVWTTDELYRSDPQALANRMGEAVETIRFWSRMAELVKVKGIGPQYAEALVRSGVAGIDALKEGKAAEIAQATNAWLDAQRQTVIKTRLTPARVQGWQKAARTMRKVKLAPHALA